MKYKLPLAELVNDFFGKLKGITKGYVSFPPSPLITPATRLIF